MVLAGLSEKVVVSDYPCPTCGDFCRVEISLNLVRLQTGLDCVAACWELVTVMHRVADCDCDWNRGLLVGERPLYAFESQDQIDVGLEINHDCEPDRGNDPGGLAESDAKSEMVDDDGQGCGDEKNVVNDGDVVS